MLGALTTKVQYLEKNNVQPQGVAQTAQPSGTNPQATQPPKKVDVTVGHFPIQGNKDAKVTVVEFADFRCPFCERFFTDTTSKLMKDYVATGKIKFAFRQYAFLGPASTTAANAAECANEQGKFWEYHDYLYKNQPPESDTSMYTTEKLTQVAQDLGLDQSQFQSCLFSTKFSQKVSDDFSDGQKAGVSGTPTTFVNGTPIVGAQPYESFKTAIDQALALTK